MPAPAPVLPDQILPLLLALPRGAVAGLLPDIAAACPSLPSELAAFGPRVASDAGLRHAARRPPARLVVEAGRVSLPVLDAALGMLGPAGVAVVLCAVDCGLLLGRCERILAQTDTGVRWLAPEIFRAGRCLLLRVGAAGAWHRIALAGSEGTESVLAACSAAGVRVSESRIDYLVPGVR